MTSTTLNNSISPQKILTRAEIVNILSKIIDVTDGKKVSVRKPLFGSISDFEDMDMDVDDDKDGISNGDEINIYHTNPFSADSEDDGLDDYTEIFITKTNPRTFDTSKDTIYDGAKVGLGLDPLAKDDPSQKFDFERTADGADFIISGHGNLYYSELKIKNAISGNRSIYSNDYELYIPKSIYSHPIDIKATMKYRESEVDINMLQVYYVSPRTMTFIPADSVNIDAGTGCITGIFENLDYDPLMRHSLWFVVGEKGLSEADKYDVVFTFDLSENMKNYDLNNDYSWMEGFINVVEQVNDGTTMAIHSYPYAYDNWYESKNKEEIQQKLADIKNTYVGQSNIIKQLERSLQNFDIMNSIGTYQNLIIGTVAKFDVDEEEFLNKITELNNNSIKVLLIVFEDNDTKIEQIKELSNQINGLLIPCRNIGDLKILLGEINKELAILKTMSSSDENINISYNDNKDSFNNPITQFLNNINLFKPIEVYSDPIWTKIEKRRETYISDFKMGKHNYSFANTDDGFYFTNNGHCTGFAFTALLNLYGKLPARMLFNTDDASVMNARMQRTQDNGDLHSVSEGDFIYDLFRMVDSNNYQSLINANLASLPAVLSDDNNVRITNSQILAMIDYWWLVANSLETNGALSYRYNTQTNSPSYATRIISDFSEEPLIEQTHPLTRTHINIIKENLQRRMPVQVGLFGFTNEWIGHSVLITGYDEDLTTGTITLTIHDNDNINNFASIILTRDNSNGVEQWAYNFPGLGNLNTITQTMNNEPIIGAIFRFINTSQYLNDIIQEPSVMATRKSSDNITIQMPEGITEDNVTFRDVSNNGLLLIDNGSVNGQTITLNDNIGTVYAGFSVTHNNTAPYFMPNIINSIQKYNTDLFKDINKNAWYTDYIFRARNRGIINGYPDGTFKPESNITRDQFLALVFGAADISFELSNDYWAKDIIVRAEEEKWITGRGNTSLVNYGGQLLTREEACDILWKVFSSTEVRVASVLIDERFLPDTLLGNQTDFERERRTRKALWNLNKTNGTMVFSDISNSNYRDSIKQLYINNVIDGIQASNNNDDTVGNPVVQFNPQGTLTRAAACKLVMNCTYSDFISN